MQLTEEIQAIINKSDSKLKTARIIFENGQYADSISSSYYAVFHIMSACLLLKNLSFSSQAQVIGAFNKEFVKSNIFPKEFTSIIQGLFEDRQSGDYNVYFNADKDLAQHSLNNAEIIINAVKEYFKQI